MKQASFLFLITCWLLMACSEDSINPSAEAFRFYQNAAIIPDSPFVSDGNHLVFSYQYRGEEHDSIADDEYEERFVFQVPAGTEHFELKGEELNKVPFIYAQLCFCYPIDSIVITDGYLQGSKKGDTHYQVEANVTFTAYEKTPDTLYARVARAAFTGTFKKSSVAPTSFTDTRLSLTD